MSSLTDNALLRKIAKAVGAGGPGQDVEIVVDGLATEDKQDEQITILTGISEDFLTAEYLPDLSTSTALGSAGNWASGDSLVNSGYIDVAKYPSIRVTLDTTTTGTLYIYQVPDVNVNVSNYYQLTYSITSPFRRSIVIPREYRWIRLLYINGGTAQTHFALTTIGDAVAFVPTPASTSDTELTPPRTLADNMANFTTPIVGAASLYWNGSVWARSQVDTYLDGLETKLDSLLAALPNTDRLDSSTSDVNDDLVAVLPGQADKRWRIYSMVVSYSADPTGGEVTVADETDTLFSGYITTGGLAPIYHQILANEGEDVTITIAAGGTGIYSRLAVSARLENV